MTTVLGSLRAALAFAALLLIPGWTLLALTGLWRRWEGLARWFVAVSLSLALFPVAFYLHRSLLLWLPLGPYKLGALLILSAGWTLWHLRGAWRELLRLDALDALTLLVIAATLFTRFWIIRDYPYPAWSDSLHHTLLTQLTAAQGHLPFTLEPYEPTPLAMYHLGLYSLSASVEWLAQVPPHTALLWTAQLLNGLCGVGVYLLLERRVGRLGALVGAVVAGLLSHQPSYYVNWGRFTQVAAQAIVLSAACVVWDALESWRDPSARRDALKLSLLAALLSAGVFLYHFRVAAFYLPVVALILVGVLWGAFRQGWGMWALGGVALIAALGLLFVSPALWEALRVYVARSTAPIEPQYTADMDTYFAFPLKAIPVLGPHPPLLWAAAVGSVPGLVRRKSMALLALGWTALLMGLGYAYLFPWRVLHVTNLGAIVIMLYLPVAMLIGTGAQALADWLDARRPRWGTALALGLTLAGIFWLAGPRLREIEVNRHFVTPADEAAMAWIRDHTPPDALFAVNTYAWMRSVSHGIDGGYWIPYFTGRATTAGTMLSSLGPREHALRIVELSALAVQLDARPETAQALRDAGVSYVYLGARAFKAATAWDAAALASNPALELVYNLNGVRIYRLHD